MRIGSSSLKCNNLSSGGMRGHNSSTRGPYATGSQDGTYRPYHRKEVLCELFFNGKCPRSPDMCYNAHGSSDYNSSVDVCKYPGRVVCDGEKCKRRHFPGMIDFSKRVLCRAYLKGKCNLKDEMCVAAHSSCDYNVEVDMCKYPGRYGCGMGVCHRRHSPDMTDFSKRVLCKEYLKGECDLPKEMCKYAHTPSDYINVIEMCKHEYGQGCGRDVCKHRHSSLIPHPYSEDILDLSKDIYGIVFDEDGTNKHLKLKTSDKVERVMDLSEKDTIKWMTSKEIDMRDCNIKIENGIRLRDYIRNLALEQYNIDIGVDSSNIIASYVFGTELIENYVNYYTTGVMNHLKDENTINNTSSQTFVLGYNSTYKYVSLYRWPTFGELMSINELRFQFKFYLFGGPNIKIGYVLVSDTETLI